MKRTIIVGDIHGCFSELLELMDKVQFCHGKDRLILLGDLINKGPDSTLVLEWAMKMDAEVIKGNHEYFLFKREKCPGELMKWVPWIKSWPLYIDDKDFIAVHGGLVPEYSLENTPGEILTTVRNWGGTAKLKHGKNDPPWFDLYDGDKKVFFGHWAAMGLIERENVVGLDTGCVYGRQLSCYILPENKLYQVQAKKCYEEIVYIDD